MKNNQRKSATTNAAAPMLANTEADSKLQFLSELLAKHKGNGVANQRARILAALRRFSLTTTEIRRFLDVFEVAARIWELRHLEGHDIPKVWVRTFTETGREHKCALYTLNPARHD